MKLSSINLLLEFQGTVNIMQWDEYADNYDPWITLEQAENVTEKAGIRPNSNKELLFMAMVNDDVVGAVWYSFEHNNDDDEAVTFDEWNVFDFDVAADPEFRSRRVGIQLIEAALEEYHSLKSEHPQTLVNVHVINPRLIGVLENKFGFDIEAEHSDGSADMVYY